MPDTYHTTIDKQVDIEPHTEFSPLNPPSLEKREAAALYGMVIDNLAQCTRDHADMLRDVSLLQPYAGLLEGIAHELTIEADFAEFLPYCPEGRAGYLEHLKQELAWRRGHD